MRQVGRVLLGVEAEARDVVLRVLRADRLQDADRDHVLRLGERRAQAHRPFELAVVVLRLPGLAAGVRGVEEQRRVVDHRRRREALLERRRVDEGLEARARLAPGLRDVVELVAGEVEAADQRADRAVCGSSATNAPRPRAAAGSASRPCSSFWTRITAPRRMRRFGGAFSVERRRPRSCRPAR